MAVLLIISAGCALAETSANGGAAAENLRITEVVSSNAGSLTDDVLGNPDWIELYNASDSAVMLAEYILDEGGNNQYQFPEAALGPGEYLVVFCCDPPEGSEPETEAEAEPTAQPTANLDMLCTGFKLSRSGTALSLVKNGNPVQELTVPELAPDVSYGVSDGEWGYFAKPTPGAQNTGDMFAAIEELQSGAGATLRITEVLPVAADVDGDEWAEIVNTGDTPVSLSEFYITDNDANPLKAQLPEMELAPGERAVVHFDGQTDGDNIPFRIGGDETALMISNRFGSEVDTFAWDERILPGFSAGRNEENMVIYYMQPTPGAPNEGEFLRTAGFEDGVSDVRINEVLRRNTYSIIDADGVRSPWIELLNTSDAAVELSEYWLSDDIGEAMMWQLPAMSLAPGEFMLIFISGKDVSDAAGELHTPFRVNPDETLYLTSLQRGTRQAVTPGAGKDNVSFGINDNGHWLYFPQPTPLAPNDTAGFETIAALPEGGGDGLLINEVATIGQAKSGDKDWVELYNSTGSDISLEGYSLSDTKNDLGKWPITIKTIEAGEYALIDRYQNGEETGDLTISMGGETLYLTAPQGVVADAFDTGVLRPGLSRGRTADGTPALMTSPTPGEQNSEETVAGYCGAPLFSVSGG